MDKSFQTSFIPQQPLLKVEGLKRRKEVINIALVIALVIFFVTLTLAGGIYFWRVILERRIADETQQLAAVENTLDVDLVARMKRAEIRLTNARQLLANHGAFSVVLDFLEQTTSKDVGLTSLSYADGLDGPSVTLAGDAPSYESVYFQLETWRGMKPFATEVFSVQWRS
jgi:hypothetical protein